MPAYDYLTCRSQERSYSDGWRDCAAGFPLLDVVVQRDEAAQQAIGEAVAKFTTAKAAAWARLIEANGGVEPTRGEPFEMGEGDDDSDPVTAGMGQPNPRKAISDDI